VAPQVFSCLFSIFLDTLTDHSTTASVSTSDGSTSAETMTVTSTTSNYSTGTSTTPLSESAIVSSGDSNIILIIVGVIVAVLLCALIVLVVILVMRRTSNSNNAEDNSVAMATLASTAMKVITQKLKRLTLLNHLESHKLAMESQHHPTTKRLLHLQLNHGRSITLS
jgi:hypothetical protein